MSTFLDIVNEILRRTGQEIVTTLVNADTPVRQTMDFVNDIYFEILETADCKFLETSATFNTTSETALYSVTSDADVFFLLKDRIRETTSNCYLTEVDPALIPSSQLDDTGKPIRFWIEGTKIRLNPVPNDTFTIEYYYLKRPVRLVNNTDNSLLPLAWERLLIRGTQSLLEKFLGEIENARLTYSLYLEGLSLLRAKTQIKAQHRLKGFYKGYQS